MRNGSNMKIWVILIGAIISMATPARAEESADKRLAAPSLADQAKAERMVRDIFKREYLDQKNRVSFAATLLKNAKETNDDPAAKYVLFRESRDQAIAAAVLDPAITAADAMTAAFAMDRDDYRIDT